MLKILIIFSFLLSSLSINAQFTFNTPPKQSPDTLYFAFKDNLQLIIINNYDTYKRYGTWYDAIYPRGSSWFMYNGPAPKNVYIFRNKEGKIINTYNADSIEGALLKDISYLNTNEFSINLIFDYTELNNHLMFYGENDKVGLINLKGEIVVPAIYDAIRKFQDRNDMRDKLIVIKDKKFGFLDSGLNVLFPPIYRTKKDTSYAGYPEHNLIDEKHIKVFYGDKCGLINNEGVVLIDFLFDDIKFIHDQKYLGLIYREKDDLTHSIKGHWNWGYQVKSCFIFDNEFNIITKLEDYEYIYYYGINRLIVKKDNKFGVVNHLGEIVVPLEYEILSQENGVYHVWKNNKVGLINLDGNIVLPAEYDQIYFYDKAIYVTKNGLIGVYNTEFKEVAAPQFKHKAWDMGKYILTREDGSKGFVNHQKDNSYYQSPEGEIIKL